MRKRSKPTIIRTAIRANNGGQVNIGTNQTAHTINNINVQPNASMRVNSSRNSVSETIQKIKNYYRDNSTIKLPVFNVPQHVKESYINLAIVDNQTQRTEERDFLQKSQDRLSDGRSGDLVNENLSTLGRPQSSEDSNKLKDCIEPKNLFNVHNRIVVIGRAGIGKSTFCKFVAYQWQEQEQHYWSKFSMLYWLPLRYIANHKFDSMRTLENELAEFIMHTMPQLNVSIDIPSQHRFPLTITEIANQLKNDLDNILLILDGYDEIQGLIEHPDPNNPQQQQASKFFINLLDKCKNYLITSRPHAVTKYTFADTIKDTAHYELLGFTNKDIEQYIRKTFSLLNKSREEKNKQELNASEAIGVLRSNSCIWGVSHIPINLALICSVWSKGLFHNIRTINMTQLYNIILLRIYKINLSKLKDYGKDESLIKLEKLLDAEKDKSFEDRLTQCQPLIEFIEILAFYGMSKNQIIFSQDEIKPLLTENLKKGINAFAEYMGIIVPNEKSQFYFQWVMQLICSIGIINSLPDAAEGEAYHFIHLTFQEYFTASHIKKTWFQNKPLMINNISISVIDYLKSIFFQPRFEVVLPFLAGKIYQEKGSGHELETYFNLIASQANTGLINNPKTLLLLTRCLEEASLANITIKDEIIYSLNTLLQRILFFTHDQKYESLTKFRKMCVDALKFSPQLVSSLEMEDRLKELIEAKDGPIWATVVHSELYSLDDHIDRLLKIIDNKGKHLNIRKAALENLVASNDIYTSEVIVSCLSENLSAEEAELRIAAWEGLVRLGKYQEKYVIEKLEEILANNTTEIALMIFSLQKLVGIKHITKSVIKSCIYLKTKTDINSELNTVLSKIENEYNDILLESCTEIIDQEKSNSTEESILLTAKAIKIYIQHAQGSIENITFLFVNVDCLYGFAVEKILLNYAKRYPKDVQDICAKILNQKVSDESLLLAARIWINDTVNDLILSTLSYLLNTECARDAATILSTANHLNHPLVAVQYQHYLQKNQSVSIVPKTSLLKFLDDLGSCSYGESSKSNPENKQFFTHRKVIEECKRNVNKKYIYISQVAAEILLEQNIIQEEIIFALVRNACSIDSSSLAKSAKNWLNKLNSSLNARHTLHNAYIKLLKSSDTDIISYSLSSLLSANTLSDQALAAIETCFEQKGDLLENYTALRQIYLQLLLQLGKLDISEHTKFSKQLASFDPKVKLAAAQILTKMQMDQYREPIIEALLSLLNCPDSNIRNTALEHLKILINKPYPRWIVLLTKNLQDPDPKITESILNGLALLLIFARPTPHPNKTDFNHPLWIYHCLSAVPSELIPVEVMEYLIKQSTNSEPMQRIGIFTMLYKHKKFDKPLVISKLHPLLQNQLPLIRLYSLQSMLSLDLTTSELIPLIKNAIKACLVDKNTAVRTYALAVVQRDKILEISDILSVFSTMILSDNQEIIDSGVIFFQSQKINSEQIDKHFSELLEKNVDSRTKVAFMKSVMIFSIQPIGIIDALMNCLASHDDSVSDAAFHALEKFKHQLMFSRLNSFLRLLLDESTNIKSVGKLLRSLPAPVSKLNIITTELLFQIFYQSKHESSDVLIWLKKFDKIPAPVLSDAFYILIRGNDREEIALNIIKYHTEKAAADDISSLRIVSENSHFKEDCDKIIHYLTHNLNLTANNNVWRCWKLAMTLFLTVPSCSLYVNEMMNIIENIFHVSSSHSQEIYTFLDDVLENAQEAPPRIRTILYSLRTYVAYAGTGIMQLSMISKTIYGLMELPIHSVSQPQFISPSDDITGHTTYRPSGDLKYYSDSYIEFLTNIFAACVTQLEKPPCYYILVATGSLAYGALRPGEQIAISLVYFQDSKNEFEILATEEYFLALINEFKDATRDIPMQEIALVDAMTSSHQQKNIYQRYIYLGGLEKRNIKQSELELLFDYNVTHVHKDLNVHDIQHGFLFPLCNIIINQHNISNNFVNFGYFSDLLMLLNEQTLFSESYAQLLIQSHQWLCDLCEQLDAESCEIDDEWLEKLDAINFILDTYYQFSETCALRNKPKLDPVFTSILLHKHKANEILSKLKKFTLCDEILQKYISLLLMRLFENGIDAYEYWCIHEKSQAEENIDSDFFILFLLNDSGKAFSADILITAKKYFEKKDSVWLWENIINNIKITNEDEMPIEDFSDYVELDRQRKLDSKYKKKIHHNEKFNFNRHVKRIEPKHVPDKRVQNETGSHIPRTEILMKQKQKNNSSTGFFNAKQYSNKSSFGNAANTSRQIIEGNNSKKSVLHMWAKEKESKNYFSEQYYIWEPKKRREPQWQGFIQRPILTIHYSFFRSLRLISWSPPSSRQDDYSLRLALNVLQQLQHIQLRI